MMTEQERMDDDLRKLSEINSAQIEALHQSMFGTWWQRSSVQIPLMLTLAVILGIVLGVYL